tara:strand:- start:2504 stop:2911 length:408 start_codon:yes stop_codon:yes gene_type:complete
MAKIISKKAVYTTRDGDTCLISIEIDDFNEIKSRGGFNAIVTDKAVNYEDVETPGETESDPPIINTVLTEISVLNRKAVFYRYAEIDALFTAIGDPVEASESFSEQLNLLQARALLIVTQQAPLYGTTAADWEIL